MKLLELQRRMSQDVMRPLTADFAMQESAETLARLYKAWSPAYLI